MAERPEFSAFVAVRSTALLRTPYLLTCDHAAAEDLLQTALTKCWKRWSRIEEPEPYVHATLLDGMDDSIRISVAPGQSVDVVRRGSRYLGAAAWGPNHGSVPWLTPGGQRGPIYPEPSTYPLVAVTPLESNSACATTTTSTAAKSGDGAWTLPHASTASSTSATDRPTWTSVRSLEGSVLPVLSDVSPADASFIAVVSGLAAYGITPPSGGCSAENPPDVTPGAAGDFVSYDGVQQVTISFRGSCEPSSTALTGQLTTFDHWTSGILDCSNIPGVGSLGHEAARLCPRGSPAHPS